MHPCDKPSKGGCEQMCEKMGNEAICKCNAGYTLEADGQSCSEGKYKIVTI